MRASRPAHSSGVITAPTQQVLLLGFRSEPALFIFAIELNRISLMPPIRTSSVRLGYIKLIVTCGFDRACDLKERLPLSLLRLPIQRTWWTATRRRERQAIRRTGEVASDWAATSVCTGQELVATVLQLDLFPKK